MASNGFDFGAERIELALTGSFGTAWRYSGILDPITNQRHGSLVESLIELENDLRVLVIGVRGKVHENQSDKIGAKLESIIRSLHKPILVINAEFKVPKRIMIAYDDSQAVEMVAKSAVQRLNLSSALRRQR